MPSSILTRGEGPIRPRGVTWTPTLAVSSSTAQVLVDGKSGLKIMVFHIVFSNKANVNADMSLRWGTVGTGADYFQMTIPSDGGGAALNLFGAEADPGALGDNLYAKSSVS